VESALCWPEGSIAEGWGGRRGAGIGGFAKAWEEEDGDDDGGAAYTLDRWWLWRLWWDAAWWAWDWDEGRGESDGASEGDDRARDSVLRRPPKRSRKTVEDMSLMSHARAAMMKAWLAVWGSWRFGLLISSEGCGGAEHNDGTIVRYMNTVLDRIERVKGLGKLLACKGNATAV
jgi:hypothetical protein